MTSCRYCGHDGAYDSGFTVECPNSECEHFSEEQSRRHTKWSKTNKLLEDYIKENPTESTSTDPDITPTYHWGITLPLDDLDED